jgi:excisionase family DNA binding protein
MDEDLVIGQTPVVEQARGDGPPDSLTVLLAGYVSEELDEPDGLPRDVKRISWAARRLGISNSTAYRLAESGKLPGAFKAGAQWRVSVPRFLREVHGALTGGHTP